MDSMQLLQQIRSGACDGPLRELYLPDTAADETQLTAVRDRAARVVQGVHDTFAPAGDAVLFSGPGRTELGGNHTDHQHGRVLCGSVDLDMLACAVPTDRPEIRILSEGYEALAVELDQLLPRPEERNTSAALVRGVAAKVQELGYSIGGFDAYMTSNVLSGSGLSSSAAYEVLIGNILNTFFCDDKLSAVEIAQIGQFAECIYFGKPCGLMDQMGSSVGGAVALDFFDPEHPKVKPVSYDFSQSGHTLCIVDTGSSHDDLTDDYADITREMGAVSAHFGEQYLRDVPESAFRDAIPTLRKTCGDRAVLRALHFYADDQRVVEEVRALETGDFASFLKLVNTSGESSALRLQNTWSVSAPQKQAIPLALTLGEELLEGTGAIRVHGGGFAGTIQAFVPNEKLDHFRAGMETVLGKGSCHCLRIRPKGGCMVLR